MLFRSYFLRGEVILFKHKLLVYPFKIIKKKGHTQTTGHFQCKQVGQGSVAELEKGSVGVAILVKLAMPN